MVRQVKIDQKDRPLWAQGINLAAEVGEDEEEDYLQVNPDIVPVFDIDVFAILSSQLNTVQDQSTVQSSESQGSKKSGQLMIKGGDIWSKEDFNALAEKEAEELKGKEKEMSEQEAIVAAEFKFEQNVKKSARVLEDELQDLNLGTEEDPKVVKISVHVEGEFKAELKELLMQYKDIFAWDYSDMKGIDPTFYQHRINLKNDVVPTKQARYRINPNYAK